MLHIQEVTAFPLLLLLWCLVTVLRESLQRQIRYKLNYHQSCVTIPLYCKMSSFVGQLPLQCVFEILGTIEEI